MSHGAEVVLRLFEGRPPNLSQDAVHDWVLEQVANNRFVVVSYMASRNMLENKEHAVNWISVEMEQIK